MEKVLRFTALEKKRIRIECWRNMGEAVWCERETLEDISVG